MPTSKILATFETIVGVTCDLTSLANGAGRISAVIDNTTTRARAGIVGVQFRMGGSAPTDKRSVRIYLIRQFDTSSNLMQGGLYRSASGSRLGDADAAVAAPEPINSRLVGVMATDNASGANAYYSELFEVYDPGPKFSFLIWNDTGQALHGTPATPALRWLPLTDESQ